ncbi:MAG: inositol monophosphatase [Bacteroidia bacterium]|nr:inositol monophosphatase [Bacteroidia bacterium]
MNTQLNLTADFLDQIQQWQTILINQIQKTGEFIRQERLKFSGDRIEFKGKNNLVSYVDRTAEEQLVSCCQQLIPNSGFVNEETGSKNLHHDFIWIIDPLDGTTNFIHGVPLYCISLALQYKQTLVLGIIYEVNRAELFSAIATQGAFLNGKKITVSTETAISNSLIATGFPYTRFEHIADYLKMLSNVMQTVRGLRRLGSAALDLAYVACGRFDCFFEALLSPWDIAAGILIIQEAGGFVSTFDGKTFPLWGKSIVASNQKVHTQLIELLAEVAQHELP